MVENFLQVLEGSKTREFSREELYTLKESSLKVHIDIGTGDGRNVYKAARNDPDTLYIGIDPVRENMTEIAVKSRKKPAKGGLNNLILTIASVEHMPEELFGIADSVSVYFPWGTLLETVIKPIEENLLHISEIAAPDAAFTFITTYSDSYEEGEITRRDLPPISMEYFQSQEYVRMMKSAGFIITEIEEYDNEFVKQFNSMWAKRLAFGRKRSFYRIAGLIKK